jgi:DNA topoisomerase-2
MWNPELIFGNLLTSSNYNDNEKKITGGRNGFGAKLANIYSTRFEIETVDTNTHQKYKQSWENNMLVCHKPKITSFSGSSYTKVTFYPDFKRFGMEGMDKDFEAVVKRRAYDVAGTMPLACKGAKVYLNGDLLKTRNFKQYVDMYVKAINKDKPEPEEGPTTTATVITETDGKRWEIGFAPSDGNFQQVSFVNSIMTPVGGTHVNYIADQVIDKLVTIVKKKDKTTAALNPSQIRSHIFIFINCHIDNPAFTSQTKEQLTTKVSAFGSKCTVSDSFL